MCLKCLPLDLEYARDFDVAIDESGNSMDWVVSRTPLPAEPGVIDIAGDHAGEIVPPGVEYYVPAGWVHPSDR